MGLLVLFFSLVYFLNRCTHRIQIPRVHYYEIKGTRLYRATQALLKQYILEIVVKLPLEHSRSHSRQKVKIFILSSVIMNQKRMAYM